MITVNVAKKLGILYALDRDVENKGWQLYRESTQYKNGKEVERLELIKEKLKSKPDGIWICSEDLKTCKREPLPANFPFQPLGVLSIPLPKLLGEKL